MFTSNHLKKKNKGKLYSKPYAEVVDMQLQTRVMAGSFDPATGTSVPPNVGAPNYNLDDDWTHFGH